MRLNNKNKLHEQFDSVASQSEVTLVQKAWQFAFILSFVGLRIVWLVAQTCLENENRLPITCQFLQQRKVMQFQKTYPYNQCLIQQ